MPKKIFIGGLSVQSSEASLDAAFGRFGTIRTLSLSPNRSAQIEYVDSQSGTDAIEAMNGATLDDSVIVVSSRP